MREIKFRGKAKASTEKLDELGMEHDNGWIYGYYVDGYIVGDVVEATNEYIALEFWWPVKRETVGQYTGLKDKNGVEIYEGDIVELTNTYKGMNTKSIVEIDFINFTFAGKWKEEYSPSGYMYNPLGSYNFPIVTIEVIGNIHDHSHLLGGDNQ